MIMGSDVLRSNCNDSSLRIESDGAYSYAGIVGDIAVKLISRRVEDTDMGVLTGHNPCIFLNRLSLEVALG